MKFIATADWHIGKNIYGKIDPQTGYHTQGLVLLEGIYQLLKHAKDNNIDQVFVTGDIFHRRNPSSMDWLLFTEILKLFIGNKIYLYIFSGNHDDLTTHTTALNPLHCINSEYIILVEDYRSVVYSSENILLCLYPYVSKRWSKKSLEDQLDEVPKGFTKKICLCHELIDGATYNGMIFQKGLSSSRLQETFDLTIAGDVHKHQLLLNSIYYTGVLVHQDYGDATTSPGFLEVTVEDQISVKHIDVNTRKFYTFEGTAKEVLEKVLTCTDSKDSVMKFKITDKQTAISNILPDLKALEIHNKTVVVESHPIVKKTIRKKLSSGLSNVQQFEEYSTHKELNQEIKNLGKQILEDLQSDS
jgi:DNA repair exonuclease SbcCD nuclease subunit